MAVQAGDSRAETIRELGRAVEGARSEGWGHLFGYVFIAPALLLYLILASGPFSAD